MQRYQPPHLRRQAEQQEDAKRAAAARHAAAWATPAAAGPSSRPTPATYTPRAPRPAINGPSHIQPQAPHASRRNWSTPDRPTVNVLASPASDLQPMRRTPAKDIDAMDMIQSVSRSGGDGAEGDALKDWAVQDKYRQYIEDKLDKHYSSFKRQRHTPPPVTEEDELHSLGSIVLLFRKLREGVVASDRLDDFAIEVFESSARLAILARNTAQLISAVSGLVPGLHLALDEKGKGRADRSDINCLTNSVGQLNVSDRRREFASILLLFQLAHVGSRQAYHSTFTELTQPTSLQLRRGQLAEISVVSPSRKPFIAVHELVYAAQAARSLAEETFDPVSYFRLIFDPERGTAYERAVLSWAEKSVRDRAWKVLSKAYLSCDRVWAGRWCGREGAAVDEWITEHGGRVEGAVIKLR